MSDLIDRQAAIDVVHRAIFDFFDICSDDDESPMTYSDLKLLELNKAITTHIRELPSAQPDLDEWCTDCKEYDQKRHCCPRFRRVIRETVEDVRQNAQPEVVRCKDCKYWNPRCNYCEGIGNWFGIVGEWGENGFCYKGERRTDGQT